MSSPTLAFACAGLFALSAFGQNTVTRSVPAKAGGRLILRAEFGQIRAVSSAPTGNNAVNVEVMFRGNGSAAEYQELLRDFTLDVSENAGTVRVDGRFSGGWVNRSGFRALYRRAPRLFDELTLARADGSYPRLLARLARTDVLVIDDWGLVPVAESERRDLLEIMEDRYGHRSTILASQLPIEKWHDQIGDPSLADAICDRLLHHAHRIVLQGESRRKKTNP